MIPFPKKKKSKNLEDCFLVKKFRVLLANTFLAGGLLFGFVCGTNVSALRHITCARERAFIISQMEKLQQVIDSKNPNPQDVILNLYSIEDALDKISRYEASRCKVYFDRFLEFLVLNRCKICSLQGAKGIYENVYSGIWYRRNIPCAPRLAPKPYPFMIDSCPIGNSCVKTSGVK